MIVNIPLQIDEAKMEEVVERDYMGKVMQKITDHVLSCLSKHSKNYYGSDKAYDGMTEMINIRIDAHLDKYRDEIIDVAAKYLADKLARSKRGKEILEDVASGE